MKKKSSRDRAGFVVFLQTGSFLFRLNMHRLKKTKITAVTVPCTQVNVVMPLAECLQDTMINRKTLRLLFFLAAAQSSDFWTESRTSCAPAFWQRRRNPGRREKTESAEGRERRIYLA